MICLDSDGTHSMERPMRGKTGATKAEILRILYGWNKLRLASISSICSQTITAIEESKEVSPYSAERIAKVLGCKAEELQQIVTPDQFIEMSRAYEKN